MKISGRNKQESTFHDIWFRLDRPHRRFYGGDEPEKKVHWFPAFAVKLLRYGIGLGAGRGATPHIADAHGGRGRVGIRKPFSFLGGEPIRSLAGVGALPHPPNPPKAGTRAIVYSSAALRQAPSVCCLPT